MPSITLLAGGVGAARLLRGLTAVVPSADLTVIVNTADDESFHGLHVSPDLDTIVYTLAGLAPIERGWGIDGDTSACREMLGRYYPDSWFALGDRDLATHIFRSDLLRNGATLSEVTRRICDSLGVDVAVLPMSDDPVRTQVLTSVGRLSFQEYLVQKHARPQVESISYRGIGRARAAPGVLEALEAADRIVVAPSNPFTSIHPILGLKGVRPLLRRRRRDVFGVSPLIGGRAVKGPLASMMRHLGSSDGVRGVAECYRGMMGTLFVAPGDAPARRWSAPLAEAVEADLLLLEPDRAAVLARRILSRPLP